MTDASGGRSIALVGSKLYLWMKWVELPARTVAGMVHCLYILSPAKSTLVTSI